MIPKKEQTNKMNSINALVLLQERVWGWRGWSCPRSQASPWGGHCVWVLGFMQERIQEHAIVKIKKVYSRRYTLHRESVGYLGRQERHQGTGLSVYIGVGNFTG